MSNGEVDEIPDYDLEFNPLWSLSETEQANVDKIKADIELVRGADCSGLCADASHGPERGS